VNRVATKEKGVDHLSEDLDFVSKAFLHDMERYRNDIEKVYGTQFDVLIYDRPLPVGISSL
jgi:hypothetical protein